MPKEGDDRVMPITNEEAREMLSFGKERRECAATKKVYDCLVCKGGLNELAHCEEWLKFTFLGRLKRALRLES